MARFYDFMDAPKWGAVRELYLQDKVVEALKTAEGLGGQDSNDLYAEAEVREHGRIWNLRDWLQIEMIESETEGVGRQIADIVAEECEGLSRRFGWDNREKTLVSLLPMDVEAPWMPGRWGYFVDKGPYDKICIPFHLIHNLAVLRLTVRHEFMHDVTLNLSAGRAPRWLNEALSTYVEGRDRSDLVHAVRSGEYPWLSPSQLEAKVSIDNRRAEDRHMIFMAYGQAQLIAHYLVEVGQEEKIGELLRALGEESLLNVIEVGVLSRSHVDIALRKAYGKSEKQIFAECHEWIMR